jgi:predicted transcriptional regulator
LTLDKIARLIGAKVLCGEEKLTEIDAPRAYACDLMSDVLALCSPAALLITGLTNIQIVRTAQMLDIPGVLFVRGKTPMRDTISLAAESGISLIISNMSMFQVCGILYAEGIKPCILSNGGE